MGRATPHRPALLVLAVFARHEAAIAWARERSEQHFGPIALASTPFVFDASRYYEAEMGTGLTKRFYAFQELIDPGTLPQVKLVTNLWEEELAATHAYDEQRPLNLDPGYVTEAKLILATTKDRDHRIYLADGIFAEGTLYYQSGAWRTRPWTYPDYARRDYHQFFSECREYLRARYRPKA
jgi:hypothetical protein